MVFLHPLWMLALAAAVVPVVLLALFRTQRTHAVVGSLRLWRQAVERLSRPSARRARRITAEWVFLTAGAAAAVLAIGQPCLLRTAPAREIALAIVPSAEAQQGGNMPQLQSEAKALLDRLGRQDQVYLVLPLVLGGTIGPLSPRDAAARVAEMKPSPARAQDLPLPPSPPSAARTYVLAPAEANLASTRQFTVLPARSSVAGTVFDSVSAVELPDGNVQVFAAVWRNRPSGGDETLIVRDGTDPNGILARASLPPGPARRQSCIVNVPLRESIAMEVGDASRRHAPELGTTAYLAREAGRRVRVAILGRQPVAVRRFFDADRDTEVVPDGNEADVLAVIGQSPPPGRPALVFCPPVPPAPRRADGELHNVALADADQVSDDPVMRNVDLAGVAIRKVASWRPAAQSDEIKPLCSVRGSVLIARAQAGPSGAATPRRIYVAPEVDEDNTNLGMSDAFVILMANALRWLAPDRPTSARYTTLSPVEAIGVVAARPDEIPPPGLYARDGKTYAVSLLGLHAGDGTAPFEPSASSVPLPEPQMRQGVVPLWPWLVLAATALWLIGWSLRQR